VNDVVAGVDQDPRARLSEDLESLERSLRAASTR
jgi:hypothetical protein